MYKATDTKLQNLKTSKPRQQRSDKKKRVAPYIDDDTDIKLQMLATAIGHTKGSLAELIIRDAINDPLNVIRIQKAFAGRAPKEYEIVARKIGEETIYRLALEDNENNY